MMRKTSTVLQRELTRLPLYNSSRTFEVAELAALDTLLANFSTLLDAALTASEAESPASAAYSARRARALSTAEERRPCALSKAPCSGPYIAELMAEEACE